MAATNVKISKINCELLYNENESGILLTLTSEKYSEHYDPMLFKQRLFQGDAASFYGLTYDLKTTQNGKTVGVWIPASQLNTIPQLYKQWKLNNTLYITSQLKEMVNFITELTKEVDETIIFPDKSGRWNIENPQKLEYIFNTIPSIKNTLPDTSETIINIVLDWLQYWFPQDKNKKKVATYIAKIRDYYEDAQVKKWLLTLENPKATYSLSDHLYTQCLKLWNGKIAPFELTLILREPARKEEEWLLESYLKELETGKMQPLSKLQDGTHPFRSNPIPFIKDRWKDVSSVFPFSTMTMINTTIELTEEEVNSFLSHGTKDLEALGVTTLVPEELKKVSAVPKINGMLEQSVDNQSHATYVQRNINWAFLINDLPVDESIFKQWVEEKRELIFLHDHWVKWNLKDAEKLWLQYRESQSNPAVYFNSLRASFEKELMEKDNHSEYKRASAVTINWELPDFWNDVSHSTLSNHWYSLLRSYQREGVQWLLKMRQFSFGACLADDMGLGKTIQTIAYIESLVSKDSRSSPHLILCPTSLVTNWAQEINTFAPSLKLHIHEGKVVERSLTLANNYESTDIIITSYPLAVRDRELLQKYKWSSLILDEAQKLKNVASKLRKSIKLIQSFHTIALTGTPVENEPKELWSIMDLLNPGYLRDEEWFFDRFIRKGLTESKAQLEQLKSLIRPFILRRTKLEFQHELTLPNKKVTQYVVKLSEEQQSLYEAVVEEYLEGKPTFTAYEKKANLFRLIMKLKQICNHPAHFLKQEWIHMEDKRSGKWRECSHLLTRLKNDGKKTLLFTQYKYMGDLIKHSLTEAWGLNIPFFHGQLNKADRYQMVTNFQRDDTPLLIVSLRAGGFGINLTSASEVIHFDRWWNPAVENQATDRVYRIGQTKPVTVHTFLSQGTIEEKLDYLINEKLQLQNQLIGTGKSSSPLWDLSDEEILEVLAIRK
ncbi:MULTISPECIES: DEAD/DEAH box helicase [Bacillaceae]|uniref:DEAD/DEAH box helicase n=1 Tax=Evansella alkalicola TaxID=745819 RepID=A0ABS6JUA6_9BACI|nr:MULTISPECIES: DEAD/DEAH box helicase [Bacillaceae]MBU9721837.1 DEAD/DEAH box helicase [Bacillus alkalicola]